MKLTFVILLFFLTHMAFGQNKYFLLSENNNSMPADWEKAQGGDTWLSFDSETGIFEGSFHRRNFSGVFEVRKVSSGMVKGFFISTQLGFLQRDALLDTEYIAMTDFIASVKRFYLYPDVLIDPEWHFMEVISSAENKTLLFVKKH